ncbi:ATP-binding cassette domain-containing protein [Streptomyces bambusae]|uniref:ATP-binding cassette domain-containing protein n=1 Tax=Streptomyces bambusae TaxID=1550616 RepID=UPI001CFFF9C9|nr:ATP-binding cassette domain-containing protein [Streptomyces bambusae]MCB5169894.1 ATP-binding cassette domain-containing protein [Streptomyces bambusae]
MELSTGIAVEVRHERDQRDMSARARVLRDLFGAEPKRDAVTLEPVTVSPRGITLVTGFSGTGKSSLLRELARHTDVLTVDDLPPIGPDDRVIDLFDEEVNEAVSWLGRFGLGEPRLMMSRPDHLSEGQRHRLMLARLAATRADLIVVDEFCSNLDRTTAKVIAHNFQRACRSLGLNAVVATAHDDLDGYVCADEHITIGFDGSVRKTSAEHEPDAHITEGFVETVGSRADYEQLGSYHYRSEEERWIDWENLVTEVRTVRMGRMLVAVKVFCRPFPQAFEALPTLRRINETVLCEERVIVHPSFRGLSLNARMWPVSDQRKVLYCQSALGRLLPFQLRAGYRRVPHPSESPTAQQSALDALLRRHDPDLNTNSTEAVAGLLHTLPEDALSDIRKITTEAFSIATQRQIVFVAELGGIEVDPADLEYVDRMSEAAVMSADVDSLAMMVETATPFKMAGFTRSWSPESGWQVPRNADR